MKVVDDNFVKETEELEKLAEMTTGEHFLKATEMAGVADIKKGGYVMVVTKDDGQIVILAESRHPSQITFALQQAIHAVTAASLGK